MFMFVSVKQRHSQLCMTSGFRRDVVEICALLAYYAGSGGNITEERRYQLQKLPKQFKTLANARGVVL